MFVYFEEGIDVDEIKDRVNMLQLLQHYNIPIQGELCKCPFHDDKNPSMLVKYDHTYCFACMESWDQIGFVQQAEQFSFTETMRWFEKHIDRISSIPTKKPPPKKKKPDYVGAVPLRHVEYWYSMLKDKHREWMIEERGLTNHTIDLMRLGWNPNLNAISIPYWRGIPRKSPIDIVQFRACDSKRDGWHYKGLTGHNRPSLLNIHVINPYEVFLFAGTFDAILAAQMGIPAVSINGITQFVAPGKHQDRLKKLLGGVEQIFIVPDKTRTELRPAYMLEEILGGRVLHLPEKMMGKDFSDFILGGHDYGIFVRTLVAQQEATQQSIFNFGAQSSSLPSILHVMLQGNAEGAETIVLTFRESHHVFPQVWKALQVMALTMFPAEFEIEEWVNFRQELTEIDWSHGDPVRAYDDLIKIVRCWADKARDNRGGF